MSAIVTGISPTIVLSFMIIPAHMCAGNCLDIDSGVECTDCGIPQALQCGCGGCLVRCTAGVLDDASQMDDQATSG